MKNKTLVHFDGHLDFDWVMPPPAGEGLHIGNFIEPAIREGIVTEFYWVVPNPFWATSGARAQVLRTLEALLAKSLPSLKTLVADANAIRFRVSDCLVTVTPFRGLPQFSKNVLLDIDTDFLTTWKCDYRPVYGTSRDPRPWMRPSEFLHQLRSRPVPSDLVTIAYSVNGGFTPLRYKFFGDRMAESLRDSRISVADTPPVGAARDYRAFQQAQACGRRSDARHLWQKMIRRDSSYRTPYAINGLYEEARHHWRRALKIYDDFRSIDPQWHELHAGRGRCLWRLKHYKEAELAFEQSEAFGGRTTLYWQGRCAQRNGNRLTAHAYWSAALERQPSDALSWHALGRSLAGARLRNKSTSHRGGIMSDVFTLETVFERSSNIVSRRVAGEAILVPLLKRQDAEAALYTLDDVAALLWDTLDGKNSVRAVIERLCAEYDVAFETAEQDVREFLKDLGEIGAVSQAAATLA